MFPVCENWDPRGQQSADSEGPIFFKKNSPERETAVATREMRARYVALSCHPRILQNKQIRARHRRHIRNHGFNIDASKKMPGNAEASYGGQITS